MTAHGLHRTFAWRVLLLDGLACTAGVGAAGVGAGVVLVLALDTPLWVTCGVSWAVEAFALWWWLTRVMPPAMWGMREQRREAT